MTNHYFLFILLFSLCTSVSALSQVEDESCLPPKKKVLKLIDEAKNSDPREASMLFKEAIEADEDNAKAYYEIAMYDNNQG
jgi:Tfp pilus assembly protein PilF